CRTCRWRCRKTTGCVPSAGSARRRSDRSAAAAMDLPRGGGGRWQRAAADPAGRPACAAMVRWSVHRRDGGALPSGCHACLAAAELKAALRPAPHAFVPRERQSMKTLLLFVATALAEIVGCYLPYLWLRRAGSAWLLLPGAIALTAFVWLLTLHPTA